MTSPAPQQHVEKIIGGLMIALGLYFCGTFVAQVWENFWPGPLFDYWIDVPLLEKAFAHTLTFSDLASAHNNAHRILIPRLLFIADYRWFAGTNILLVTVSVLCKCATLALLWHLLRAFAPPWRAVALALACAAIFNSATVYNVLFNFDIQWDLVSAFACFAVFFHARLLAGKRPWLSRTLAWLMLLLAFFSQAGALSLPPVFLVMSLAQKNHRESAIDAALTLLVLFVHNRLPFADPSNPDMGSAFGMLVLHPFVVAAFVFKALSATLAFYLGHAGFFFSVTTLLCFASGMASLHRRTSPETMTLASIALFLFLMIVTIAAARSVFTPQVWGASRFQTTVLLFALCVHLDALQRLVGDPARLASRAATLVAANGFAMLMLVQVFNDNIAYKLSNAVFFSHAYMLTHGRSQDHAPRLLLWLHGDDVIANSDRFFREHGFAWYANKRVATPQGIDFVDSGNVVVGARMAAQSPTCTRVPALHYHETTEGGIEFATALDTVFPLRRETYYAIGADGRVSGFAYVSTDEQGLSKHAALQGYSLNRDIVAFIDADDNHLPHCAYRVSSQP